MTLADYLKYNGLVLGEDYYVDSDTDNVTSLSDKADELISEFNSRDDIEMIDDMVVDESKVKLKDEPSQILIEYAIGSGLTEKEAYYFYKKHPEFIGCEKDPEKLHMLGESLEAEKDALSIKNNIDSSGKSNIYRFVEDPDTVSKNSDYIGLSEEEVNDLDSRGAAVKIVNKWLCKALDKNDEEMVRNACIVLKAIERKAYTDSLDISVTEDNGVYKVEAKSSYNNYEDSKVCYISKKSDGNLYVKFHEFSGLNGHLEGDSDYWGLNFALGAPSWMITSQEHEWDNVISKIINKLSSENLTTNA